MNPLTNALIAALAEKPERLHDMVAGQPNPEACAAEVSRLDDAIIEAGGGNHTVEATIMGVLLALFEARTQATHCACGQRHPYDNVLAMVQQTRLETLEALLRRLKEDEADAAD